MGVIDGGPAGESLEGTGDADSISGNGGDDRIEGLAGDDKLYGGIGNDYLYDSDSGSADTASDVDLMYGGAGNDVLISNQGSHFQDNDELYGGDGDDNLILNGVQTDDKIYGGAGNDLAQIRLGGDFRSIVALFNPAGFEVQIAGVNTVFVAGVERIFIETGSGSDILAGGAGDDGFTSHGGNDNISGGGGDDAVSIDLYGSSSVGQTVTLSGGSGTDALSWTARGNSAEALLMDIVAGNFTSGGVSLGSITGFETLYVSAANGNDTLTGGANDDIFNASGGNDILRGNGGDDLLRGDDGSDTVYGGAGNDKIELDNGFGSSTFTNVGYGGDGADTFEGGSLADTFNGGAGDDFYFWETGDVIVDSAGIDTIYVSLSTFDMTAFGSVENVIMGNFNANVTGNALGNHISYEDPEFAGVMQAHGGLGDDTITGGDIFDRLYGDGGKDRLFGGSGGDELYGGLANDQVYGGAGGDSVNGNAGNDTVYGGNDGDRVTGLDGNDVLYGDNALDTTGFTMGSGVLTKTASQATSFATAVNLNAGYGLTETTDVIGSTYVPHLTVNGTLNSSKVDYFAVNLVAGQTITLDIDRASLSGTLETQLVIFDADFREVANSPSSTSTSVGGTGSTSFYDAYLSFTATASGTYYIRLHDDTFFGATSTRYVLNVSVGEGGGADIVNGGVGDDRLYGGFQDDTLLGGAGNDTLDGGIGRDTASYADATAGVKVSLLIAAPQATIGGGRDQLIGIENLTGGGGADSLTGNGQANVLAGGAKADTLIGNSGDDTLSGGAGNDRLTGSAGHDHFLFELAPGTLAGVDTIIGFAVAQDVIDLAAEKFAALTDPIAAAQFRIGTAATTTSQHLIYNAATGVLSYDDDGSGGHAAVAFAQLATGLALTAANFDLV